MTRRILVTDGQTRASLATARSLGTAGLEVHVVTSTPDCLAGASRYVSAEHLLPDCATDPRMWANDLFELVRDLDAELVLPMTEVSLGTLFAMRRDHDANCAVACPSPSAYEAAVDKTALLERAQRLGIDVPKSVGYASPSEVGTLPAALAYPIVVKSRRSQWMHEDRWCEGSVQIARDTDELQRALAHPGFAAGLMLQEFIPGHGEAVFLLAEQGQTRAAFAHRRLREKPPTGGQSVLRESIAPDPALLEASEKLLGELNWTGVAMVEFRRAPDGRAALMEINPRLWGSVQLAIDAGVDFPSLLVAMHHGEPIPTTAPVLGVRTRWLLGDLDHLAISLRRARIRREIGRGIGGLLWDFARSFADGSRTEIWRSDDRQPFYRELRARLAPAAIKPGASQ